jgi:hypothetical protein
MKGRTIKKLKALCGSDAAASREVVRMAACIVTAHINGVVSVLAETMVDPDLHRSWASAGLEKDIQALYRDLSHAQVSISSMKERIEKLQKSSS